MRIKGVTSYKMLKTEPNIWEVLKKYLYVYFAFVVILRPMGLEVKIKIWPLESGIPATSPYRVVCHL